MMDIERQKKIGRKLGLFILLLWILVCMSVTIKLYVDKNYYGMTGWLIASVALLLVGVFYLIPARERGVRKVYPRNDVVDICVTDIAGKDPLELVVLVSTKNCVFAQAVHDALEQSNITCVILDKHSAQLMRFLPDVEMRILVSVKDYEKSVELVEGLAKPE